ncbi:MAG: ABC transporter ATP-binding protein [Phycisphaerae bacterium]|nr:ABC transporter ATP-binding protein [Phycisphaerae bacterium]
MSSGLAIAAEINTTGGKHAILVRGLTRRFGKVQALHGLDLTISPGSITGFVGNNGAGKTTAMHTLMGFLPPNEGTVSIFGLDPRRDAREIRKRVGFFPERDQPYDWIRLKNLFDVGAATYADWDRSLCEALCRQFDLDLNRRIKQLSRGMVAKAKLIFAFAHHPECLLLDEPTTGLDPSSRHDVLRMIQELMRTRSVTTLFSSHNLDDVAGIATDLIVIHEGKAVFSGDMHNIQSNLALVEVAGWTGDVPHTLSPHLVKSARQPHASLWLLRDRGSQALAEFRQMHDSKQVTVKAPSLVELFLFLTSGALEPQAQDD